MREVIRAFEAELDAALAGLAVYGFDADQSLALAANIYETFASDKRHPAGAGPGPLDRGMTILGSRLVSGSSGAAPDLEALAHDLFFASHYYMLREYLYYSYNVPGSMTWSFSEKRVEVRFSDPTIPRQFFTVFNDMLLLSRDMFTSFTAGEEIRRLLEGEPEGQQTPDAEAAFALIAQEVEIKLRAYFSILPMDAEIALGGYSYGQFVAFYRRLLEKALYHRYLAKLDDAVGAIFIAEDELVAAAQEDPGLPPSVTRAILADIVFDGAAVASKADASYFSLFREGASSRIVMRSHHFALAEGLVNLLRVVAQRRPRAFLDRVSNALGKAFVQRVRAAWEAEGFVAHADVSLRSFDPALPDIDLLVISEEPTLGYVVFVCELKSPIPPRWAKDQLKALNNDSVSKAFRQAEAVRRFIRTDEGVAFLRAKLPPEGIPHFDGFIVVVDHLVITSDNAGMFFGQENTKIINFRTLERLLARSDGDMAFIQHVLATYNEKADKLVNKAMMEFKLAGRTVAYEGVADCPMLDFPQACWRNSPERQAMIDQFIADGAHPFDVLPSDARKQDATAAERNPGLPTKVVRPPDGI